MLVVRAPDAASGPSRRLRISSNPDAECRVSGGSPLPALGIVLLAGWCVVRLEHGWPGRLWRARLTSVFWHLSSDRGPVAQVVRAYA
jgi:hypothetical protein